MNKSWTHIAKDMLRRCRIAWTRHDEISYQDIRNRRVDWDGRILGSAHKWIPAITDMFLKLSGHNSILRAFGLYKRLPNRFTFAPLKSNMKMNRYMEYQVKRLRQLKDTKPEKFWRIAWKLSIHSTAFRVSVINTVYKKWYKSLTWVTVLRINRQATVILKNMRTNLALHRVYIPKGPGTFRPLGVPKDSWRVALKLLHNFMSIFLEGRISTSQHAYQPGKGCLTAWRELVPKLYSYPNIWEYDLKGCFDEIRLDYVSSKLSSIGMPDKFVKWIEGINLTVPTFPKEIKADERRQVFKALEQDLPQKAIFVDNIEDPESLAAAESFGESTHDNIMRNIKNKPISLFFYRIGCWLGNHVGTKKMIKEFQVEHYTRPKLTSSKVNLSAANEILRRAPEDGGMSEGFHTFDELIHAQFKAFQDRMPNAPPLTKNRGLAQGSNLSPLLTILALEKFFNTLEHWIAYADDFIRFSFVNKEIVKDDVSTGVVINWNKSKQLKKDGVWLVEKFKFLGLEFITSTGEIQGATRNGSRLKMNAMAKGIWNINWEVRKDDNWNGIEALFNQSLDGWFQSQLFQDTWDLIFYEWRSKFQYTGIKGSLLSLAKMEDNCVSTSSYCCMLLGQRLRLKSARKLRTSKFQQKKILSSSGRRIS